jgi:hypothetical protein
MSLRDIPWYETRNAPSEIYSKLDRLFAVILPTSNRWEAFTISTFHPAVFRHVQRICADISADALGVLDLDYTYMPGYSLMDIAGATTYDLPFVPSIWFRDRYPSPIRLAFCSTQINWLRIGLFDSLVDIKLVHVTLGSLLDWSVFQSLFQTAGRLESVEINNISPFDLPSDGFLYSSSVRRLDVTFPEDPPSIHLAEFIHRFRFPNLHSLVARSFVWTDVGQLALSKDILSPIRIFTLIGLCEDYSGARSLFDSMSNVSVLDFTEARGCAFRSFRDWSLHRTTFASPLPILPLLHLSVGRIDCISLLSLLAVYTGSSPYSTSRVQRLDLYYPMETESWCLDMFRVLVKDVRLIPAAFPDYMDPLPWGMFSDNPQLTA